MLPISDGITLSDNEIEITAVRAQGPGGQNVNKVASAIHLRFDIAASSLPEEWKQRLLALKDQRITREGVIVIKAQQARSYERNREEALRRLLSLIASVATPPKERKPTKATFSSRQKRLEQKNARGRIKAMRGRVLD